MPELPATDKGNVFFTKRYFGALVAFLLIVVILLTVTLWFLQRISKEKTSWPKEVFLENFKKSTEEVDFGGYLRKTRYLDNFEISATAEAKPDKYNPLYQNFGYLASAYRASHDPFLRTKALELGNYLKATYQEESSEYKFEVECLDGSCTSVEYSDDLKEILRLVDSAKFPEDSDYAGFFKRSLETAVIKTDKNEKFNAYIAAFQYLWLAYQKKPDANVKDAGQKLLVFIDSSYPQELAKIKAIDGENKFIFK